ncbi:hypothetical protein AB0J94_10880 [Micromonospora noduli]|uniref:Uncharacterized protein n=1 Tax=Micromonospora noduli TaxID=709876 RepID=A0ABX9CT68_9ACTN|nr:hypothetical protein [Micromonospora noduli]KAB1926072.1 hypothetical protein F8280_10880 [Micromonospora noduli]RAO09670.1 hypothetical protein MED15_05959 [Micromonospora noduli]RAO19098.1 hypothetical protein GUI43_00772 [Micromonospora noduli]RAO20178.1 hypothetical protein LUPAC07_01677 [Micromonospora noduli]RAO39835.1 hypothetical protein ONO23_00531 [Micromonospora noduli]
MTDLDERIARALREQADGPVDTNSLLTAAVNGGRARRRRRRAVIGAALGVAVLLGAGVAVRTPSAAPPQPAVTPSPVVVTPPRAPGVPGAAERPALIGTDPRLLHFGVDPTAAKPVAWRSAAQVESMRLDLGDGVQAMVIVAADPRTAEIGDPSQLRDIGPDKAGAVTSDKDLASPGQGLDAASRYNGVIRQLDRVTKGWVLRWQPVPGLYVRVAALGETGAEVRRAAAALRFDEARRCVAPIQLTALPPGARISACEVAVRQLSWPRIVNVGGMTTPTQMAVAASDHTEAALTVALQGAATLPVRLTYLPRPSSPDRAKANRRIAGRPVFDMGDFWHVLGIPNTLLSMGHENRWERSPTDAEVSTVIGGLRVADDRGEPASWE